MSEQPLPTLPTVILTILERSGADMRNTRKLQGGTDEIVIVPIPRVDAIEIWHALRALVSKTGLWPVLLGDDGAIESHESHLREHQDMTTVDMLRAAQDMDIATWVKEEKARWEAAWERFKQEEGPEFAAFYEHEDADDSDDGLHGPWPEYHEPTTRFRSTTHPYWDESQDTFYLGLVPTTESWQVPAFLRFDFGDDAPSPVAHAAHALAWGQNYGAEIVCMTDCIEMLVSRPPQDREAALDLARHQYDYCSDIVAQGTGTIEVLAASLLDAPRWFFWWD